MHKHLWSSHLHPICECSYCSLQTKHLDFSLYNGKDIKHRLDPKWCGWVKPPGGGSHTQCQHISFYESLIKALFYGSLGQLWQGKRNVFWWSLHFLHLKSLLHFPTDPVCVSVYLFFYINCPLLNYTISISSRLQPLSLRHSFLHQSPWPIFHLFLWGTFLSDIDWIYSSAAVNLWKWEVTLWRARIIAGIMMAACVKVDDKMLLWRLCGLQKQIAVLLVFFKQLYFCLFPHSQDTASDHHTTGICHHL